MRILCVESDRGVSAAVTERLEAGGHEVVTCHDGQAGPAWPCRELDRPGSCPLDGEQPVDVVVDVRRPGHPLPSLREAGASCAVRRSLPLVVVGDPAGPNPFARWGEAVAGDGDVAGACARASRRAAEGLGDLVSIAVCRVLGDGHRPGVDVGTDVRRQGGELLVTVHRPESERELDGLIAARAHQALRASGVEATSISVSCAS